MKQALKVVDEIKRMKAAIDNTNSAYLKNDYAKGIRRLQNELREYCGYRGYCFKEIISDALGDI